jgi:uncharacterized protein YprB with RNaseH-like and TPR domain
MIESSFCVLSGVGLKTERRLWQGGVGTWTEFLSFGTIPGIRPSRKTVYDAELAQAQNRRAQEDARYFGTKLPAREHWRLYEWLRPRAVYLDIETNSWGQITVVGLYGQGSFTSLVEGESLTRQRICEELAQYDLLVTFNGTSFDLPVLLASIQGIPLDQPHVDLCLLGRQLGYRGGLKAIEHQLGSSRRADLWGMSGADAGQLWNRCTIPHRHRVACPLQWSALIRLVFTIPFRPSVWRIPPSEVRT